MKVFQDTSSIHEKHVKLREMWLSNSIETG